MKRTVLATAILTAMVGNQALADGFKFRLPITSAISETNTPFTPEWNTKEPVSEMCEGDYTLINGTCYINSYDENTSDIPDDVRDNLVNNDQCESLYTLNTEGTKSCDLDVSEEDDENYNGDGILNITHTSSPVGIFHSYYNYQYYLSIESENLNYSHPILLNIYASSDGVTINNSPYDISSTIFLNEENVIESASIKNFPFQHNFSDFLYPPGDERVLAGSLKKNGVNMTGFSILLGGLNVTRDAYYLIGRVSGVDNDGNVIVRTYSIPNSTTPELKIFVNHYLDGSNPSCDSDSTPIVSDGSAGSLYDNGIEVCSLNVVDRDRLIDYGYSRNQSGCNNLPVGNYFYVHPEDSGYEYDYPAGSSYYDACVLEDYYLEPTVIPDGNDGNNNDLDIINVELYSSWTGIDAPFSLDISEIDTNYPINIKAYYDNYENDTSSSGYNFTGSFYYEENGNISNVDIINGTEKELPNPGEYVIYNEVINFSFISFYTMYNFFGVEDLIFEVEFTDNNGNNAVSNKVINIYSTSFVN